MKGLLARWYLQLAAYLQNICLKYKPGAANQTADALSYAPHGQDQVLHIELRYYEKIRKFTTDKIP